MFTKNLLRKCRSPHWRRVFYKRLRSDNGAASVEYLLILALIVIPLGLLLIAYAPHMIKLYNDRMSDFVALPFP